MTALNTLFEKFGLLLDAPNSVQKMRELILQLAVQGKLVPQDPNDEPASELLKKIKVEKEKLIKEMKIKKEKSVAPIQPDEIPYELPKGWERVRLGSVTQINPRNYLSDDTDVSFIPMNLIEDGFNNRHKSETKKWSEIKSGFTHFQENDVVVAKITPCFQNRKSVVMKNLVNGHGAGTTELYVVRSFNETIISEYLLLLFKVNSFINGGVSTFTGTAGQQRVKKDYMHTLILGLPSISEQKRIVAKVDQLMNLCDELETKQQKVSKNRIALNDIALEKLATSDNSDFSNQWAFVHGNFDLLYLVPENVTKLRQTILQLAVQGKLVPQDLNDELASELLRKIKSEKEKIVKGKKIKKEKPLPPVQPDEIPYELPKGWEWIRLGNVIDLLSGQHIQNVDYNKNGVGYPYLTGPSDFGDKNPQISKWTTKPKVLAGLNDILLTVKGSGVGKINSLNIDNVAVSRQLMAVRPVLINTDFIYLYLLDKSSHFQSKKIGIAIPGISREDVLHSLIGIPPIAEQKRIVAKVDQLMKLCNDLESRLHQSQKDSEMLMQAVLQDAFN